MTEIPEHLLKRAAEARAKATAAARLIMGGVPEMTVQKFKAPEGCHHFRLIRRVDETGISGNGCVLEGVKFSTGKVVVNWLSDKGSVVVWDSLEDFLDIHVRSHPVNRSLIIWDDGTTWEHTPK